MNILILGGGGREHALAWAIRQNPKCDRLIVAPGNAGIAAIARCADLAILDGQAVAAFCDESLPPPTKTIRRTTTSTANSAKTAASTRRRQ
mgnify:CR=1 FL=1